MRRLDTVIFFVLLGCYSSPAAADACVYVPSKETPAVTACETDDRFTYDITGNAYSYAKETYAARLNDMLATWLASVGLAAPEDATIELWLAVPEASPGAAQGRAVLRSSTLNLVWYLSLHPDEWTLADRDVGILPRGGVYPQSFGHRPRQLLVKARGDDETTRRALLAAHGAINPEPYALGWSTYDTAAAVELAVSSEAMGDPKTAALVERVEVNHIVEWIAVRQLAFTFAFSPMSP